MPNLATSRPFNACTRTEHAMTRFARLPWPLGVSFFFFFVLFASLAGQTFQAEPSNRKTENLILITLDGVRTEEMFRGADLELLQAQAGDQPVETSALYRRFWADSPRERREILMPFFWKVWMKEHGSIAGNRWQDSEVLLKNKRWFSYPGYAEILTGKARDEAIDSNAKIQNPFPTVLEFLKEELDLAPKETAAFACWEVMDYIVESKPGTIFSNAGFEDYDEKDRRIQALNRLQHATRTPWDSVRHDVYTFQFAMSHLQHYRPKVLYLSLGETDDWGHEGRYDRVLQVLRQTDAYFQELWRFLQSNPQYQDRTTLLITTDHGRGTGPESWKHHGADSAASQFTWLAAVSPDSALRGEWADTETVYMDQIAATLCRYIGLDKEFARRHPEAGPPIEALFE